MTMQCHDMVHGSGRARGTNESVAVTGTLSLCHCQCVSENVSPVTESRSAHSTVKVTV